MESVLGRQASSDISVVPGIGAYNGGHSMHLSHCGSRHEQVFEQVCGPFVIAGPQTSPSHAKHVSDAYGG